jgi:hypothetical protein
MHRIDIRIVVVIEECDVVTEEEGAYYEENFLILEHASNPFHLLKNSCDHYQSHDAFANYFRLFSERIRFRTIIIHSETP